MLLPFPLRFVEERFSSPVVVDNVAVTACISCAICCKGRDCFGFLPLNVMQTYGKKQEAPVASSNFSTFFFPSFTDVEGILKSIQQPLLMNNKKCWSSLIVAWMLRCLGGVSFGLGNLDLAWTANSKTMFFISLSMMWAISSFNKCIMIQSEQENYWILGYLVFVLSSLSFSSFTR